MFKLIPTAVTVLALATLVGCNSSDSSNDTSDNPPADTRSASEQGAAASQTLGMLVDASTESMLNTASSSDSGKVLVPAGAELYPDLTTVGKGVIKTVNLATLAINGQPVFPSGSVSGTITIDSSGTAATSWPAGTTQLYTGSVTVALANVVFTNSNGDSVSIPSGTFVHTLEANATKTDSFNWTITTDTTATADTALYGTVTHNGISHTLSLNGQRKAQQTITRVYTTANGAVTANTRTTDRQIYGSTPGANLTTDSTLAAKDFTSWIVTVDGTPVEWNRYAQLTTTWDFTKIGTGSAFSVTAASDSTYITTTKSGSQVRVGPYTAAVAASLMKAHIDANWL